MEHPSATRRPLSYPFTELRRGESCRIHCPQGASDAGAWDGDDQVHFVTGNFCLMPEYHIDQALTLWKNLGPKKGD